MTIAGNLRVVEVSADWPFVVCGNRARSGQQATTLDPQAVEGLLDQHGAILLRGFGVETSADFARLIRNAGLAPLPYIERSSPRTEVRDNIYTSTEYTASEEIFLHNEQSYNDVFPLRITFCCLQPSLVGGQTPIADCRQVFNRISSPVLSRFSEGYLLVRNFNGCAGLGWQEAFQTTDPLSVEAYCRSRAIGFRWFSPDHLQTRQRRKAFARHPRTGQWTWFNHCTFFNVAALPSAVRTMVSDLSPEDIPCQTYYADGREIEPAVVQELGAAYEAEKRQFDWQRGDVLMLDNMLVAHGRRSFRGSRQVHVAMSTPTSWASLGMNGGF